MCLEKVTLSRRIPNEYLEPTAHALGRCEISNNCTNNVKPPFSKLRLRPVLCVHKPLVQGFFIKTNTKKLLADTHAHINGCFTLFAVCHEDSSLLNSSLKIIRLFELTNWGGSAPPLVNGLQDQALIGLLNR